MVQISQMMMANGSPRLMVVTKERDLGLVVVQSLVGITILSFIKVKVQGHLSLIIQWNVRYVERKAILLVTAIRI